MGQYQLTRKGWTLASVLALIIVSILIGAYVLISQDSKAGPKSKPAPAQVKNESKSKTRDPGGNVVPYSTKVAQLYQATPVYNRPGGKRIKIAPATWYDVPSYLPILEFKGQWLRVRLAQRPNGSTGWIKYDPKIKIFSTPDYIFISLKTRKLYWYHKARLKMTTPAGLGTKETPTPDGNFFVAFRAKTPSPSYGKEMLVLSAHSEAIGNWDGSDDAIVAIHGPVGQDQAVAKGSRLSHGCVRISIDALKRIDHLLPGTLTTIG